MPVVLNHMGWISRGFRIVPTVFIRSNDSAILFVSDKQQTYVPYKTSLTPIDLWIKHTLPVTSIGGDSEIVPPLADFMTSVAGSTTTCRIRLRFQVYVI